MEIDCPECGGCGYLVEAGCCGSPTRWGECCGNPIPVQAQCGTCGGDGKIEVPEPLCDPDATISIGPIQDNDPSQDFHAAISTPGGLR